jgi:hypothetical protein
VTIPGWGIVLLILAGALGLVWLTAQVSRWFAQGIQSLVLLTVGHPLTAVYVYHALVLPGTVLHEVSHLAVGRLLGVPAGRLTLAPSLREAGTVQLGSVHIAQVDRLRESLIGLAPFPAGVAAITLIGSYALGLPGPEAILADPMGAVTQLLAARDPGAWLYLMAAIGNTMLPSASDRRRWLATAALAVGVTGLLTVATVSWPDTGFARWVISTGRAVLVSTGVALLMTIAADLAAGLLVRLIRMPFRGRA